MDRRAVGSWLQGPRAASAEGASGYPGERLGRPPEGAGSIASFGRRLVALVVDWLLCVLVAKGLLHGSPADNLAVFAGENLLLVGTAGFTVGMRLVGIRVVRLDGSWAGPLPAVIRTVLLCLFIPAVIWDRDQRGLHDRAAGTVLVRR